MDEPPNALITTCGSGVRMASGAFAIASCIARFTSLGGVL